MFHPQAPPNASITSLLSRQHTACLPRAWPPADFASSEGSRRGICRKTHLPNCWQCHFLETTLMAEDLSKSQSLLHQCLVMCTVSEEPPPLC